jgi:hypothetical protein
MRIEDLILAELKQRKPARLLAEGMAARMLAQDYLSIREDSALVAASEMADLALAFLEAELAREQALALIGQLKQQAPALLIAARESQPLIFNDFLAFGMQRLAEADDGHLLYLFDLHTYKPAPDWLNSKYWAHPELWKP